MKKYLFLPLMLGFMLCGACSEKGCEGPEGPEATRPYTDVDPLTELKYWTPTADEAGALKAMADFAYTLNGAAITSYKKLWMTDASGNYSLSPVSVSALLATLSQSVDGSARKDICNLLGLAESEAADLHNKLQRYLSKNEDWMQIIISNSVWHVTEMTVCEEYKNRMAELFGAPVNELNLYSDTSADVLNRWCSDKTGGMIDRMFQTAPMVDFLIANAIYFSAEWGYPFNEKYTTLDKFRGLGGESEVEMMHGTKLTRYANCDGTEYTWMPYASDFGMDIIVPAAGTDMDKFGKSLTADVVAQYERAADAKFVDLELPKFRDERQCDMLSVLCSLGLPENAMANTVVTGREGTYFRNSVIKHATALVVDEKGTRLSAVTSSGLDSGNFTDLGHVAMKVDRPFYYIVRNKTTNAVLLIGRVCNI